jgi:hypothetical protein
MLSLPYNSEGLSPKDNPYRERQPVLTPLTGSKELVLFFALPKRFPERPGNTRDLDNIQLHNIYPK